VDQTKIVTAASELARNTLIYGGGGEVALEPVSEGVRKGLRLVFSDRGPGIANIEAALKDGYTTGNGLGLGLGGAKRLSNEFRIDSRPGEGHGDDRAMEMIPLTLVIAIDDPSGVAEARRCAARWQASSISARRQPGIWRSA
jgi:signal transduction histidine kinase